MQSKEPFEKVGEIFCDGIILPRLEQLFSTYKDFEATFHSAGIQVQKISPAQKDEFVYVRLLDSANAFTVEFIVKLNAFVQGLRKRLREKKQRQEVIDSCFIHQIDCTQDMKGFFLSFDVKADIGSLSKLMKMDLTRDYPTFESLFTLLNKHNYGTEECPLMLKQLRFKIYNKLLHFLESEQGKKKISMNLKALLNCSSQFYQKLLQCTNNGVSRLEFSHYFYSFDESQQINVQKYQQDINSAFEQVNKLPQIRYQVPFKLFFKNFWNSSKPVFIFQKDSWTVIYAKHSKSAYIGQTVKITSKRFKNDDKIDIIKRFTIPGRWCTVVDTANGKVSKVMKSGKKLMQIPIQSLNTIHTKSYNFDFNSQVFRYYLYDEELDNIKLVLESGKDFEFPENLEVSTHNKKRQQKQKEKEEEKGIEVTDFVQHNKDKNSRWLTLSQPGYELCKFISSKSTGRLYGCEHCNHTLQRKGKSQLFLF